MTSFSLFTHSTSIRSLPTSESSYSSPLSSPSSIRPSTTSVNKSKNKHSVTRKSTKSAINILARTKFDAHKLFSFFSFGDLISYSLINRRAVKVVNNYLHKQSEQENLYIKCATDLTAIPSYLSSTSVYRNYSSKPDVISFRYRYPYHTIREIPSTIADLIHPSSTDCLPLSSLDANSITLSFNQSSSIKTYRFDRPLNVETVTWTVLGYNEHRVALLKTSNAQTVTIDSVQRPTEFIRILHLSHNTAYLQSKRLHAIYGKPNFFGKFASVENVHWISNSQFIYVTNRGIIGLFDLDKSKTPMIFDHFNARREMERPPIKSLYENGYLITLSSLDTVCVWNMKAILNLKDFFLTNSHAAMQSNQLLTVISMRNKPISDPSENQSENDKPKIDFGVRAVNQYAFTFPILVALVHDFKAKSGRLVFTNILNRKLYQYYLPLISQPKDVHKERISFDGRVVKLQQGARAYIIKPDSKKPNPLPITL